MERTKFTVKRIKLTKGLRMKSSQRFVNIIHLRINEINQKIRKEHN